MQTKTAPELEGTEGPTSDDSPNLLLAAVLPSTLIPLSACVVIVIICCIVR